MWKSIGLVVLSNRILPDVAEVESTEQFSSRLLGSFLITSTIYPFSAFRVSLISMFWVLWLGIVDIRGDLMEEEAHKVCPHIRFFLFFSNATNYCLGDLTMA